MKTRIANAACGLFLLLLPCVASPVLGDCGKERWPVKTLQDPGEDKVNAKPDVTGTVADLRKLTPPVDLRKVASSVRFPQEYTTYHVHALLMGFKKESDEDYHIVIGDLQNPKLTMVVEVPNPECANKAYARQFAAVRAFVESIHKPAAKFYHMPKPVKITVTGIFFFDFIHGQTGVAPNGAEIHPVLQITTP